MRKYHAVQFQAVLSCGISARTKRLLKRQDRCATDSGAADYSSIERDVTHASTPHRLTLHLGV